MTNLPAPEGNGGNGDGNGWPKANPLRGLGYADEAMTITYVDLALDFIKKFPIDVFLTWRSFDEWLASHGLLTIPPEDTPKGADAWIGHVDRRGDFRDRINMAALHPRMFELNSVPYYIAALPKSGGYQVREPHNPASMSNIMRRLKTLTDTTRRRIEYHLQSSDWLTLPEQYRILVAEMLCMDIALINQQMSMQLDSIDQKVNQMLQRLSLITPDGKMQPSFRQRQLEAPEAVGFVETDDEPAEPEGQTAPPQNTTFNKLCNTLGVHKEEEETHNGFKHRALHILNAMPEDDKEQLSEDIKDWYQKAAYIDDKNRERHTNYALPHLEGLDNNGNDKTGK